MVKIEIKEESTTVIEVTDKSFRMEEETTYTITTGNGIVYKTDNEREMKKIINKMLKNA